jgi:hypothetical protein
MGTRWKSGSGGAAAAGRGRWRGRGWDTLGGEVGKKEREKEEGKLRRTTHGQGSRIFIWEEIDKKTRQM